MTTFFAVRLQTAVFKYYKITEQTASGTTTILGARAHSLFFIKLNLFEYAFLSRVITPREAQVSIQKYQFQQVCYLHLPVFWMCFFFISGIKTKCESMFWVLAMFIFFLSASVCWLDDH